MMIAKEPTNLGVTDGPDRCLFCNGSGLLTERFIDPFIYGDGDRVEQVELSCVVEVHTCKSCLTSYYGRDAHRAQEEAVTRHWASKGGERKHPSGEAYWGEQDAR